MSRPQLYKSLFFLWGQLGIGEDGRRAMIWRYTGEKSDSLGHCGMDTLKQMKADMVKQLPQPSSKDWEQQKAARTKMGKKIIAICCEMGMVDGKHPDYARINSLIEHIGSNNPKGGKLWELNYSEMQACLSQVEQIHKDKVKQ